MQTQRRGAGFVGHKPLHRDFCAGEQPDACVSFAGSQVALNAAASITSVCAHSCVLAGWGGVAGGWPSVTGLNQDAWGRGRLPARLPVVRLLLAVELRLPLPCRPLSWGYLPPLSAPAPSGPCWYISSPCPLTRALLSTFTGSCDWVRPTWIISLWMKPVN